MAYIRDWNSLSAFRTSELLKVGYLGVVLVPIWSTLVLHLENLFPSVELSVPVPLLLLFVGSFLLSVAHFLNDFFCPPVIKRFDTFDAYVAFIARHDSDLQAIIKAQIECEKNEIFKSMEEKGLGDSTFNKVVAEVLAESSIEKDVIRRTEIITEQHSKKWDDLNETKRFLRGVIITFYVISGVILLLLLFRQLWIVFQASFS